MSIKTDEGVFKVRLFYSDAMFTRIGNGLGEFMEAEISGNGFSEKVTLHSNDSASWTSGDGVYVPKQYSVIFKSDERGPWSDKGCELRLKLNFRVCPEYPYSYIRKYGRDAAETGLESAEVTNLWRPGKHAGVEVQKTTVEQINKTDPERASERVERFNDSVAYWPIGREKHIFALKYDVQSHRYLVRIPGYDTGHTLILDKDIWIPESIGEEVIRIGEDGRKQFEATNYLRDYLRTVTDVPLERNEMNQDAIMGLRMMNGQSAYDPGKRVDSGSRSSRSSPELAALETPRQEPNLNGLLMPEAQFLVPQFHFVPDGADRGQVSGPFGVSQRVVRKADGRWYQDGGFQTGNLPACAAALARFVHNLETNPSTTSSPPPSNPDPWPPRPKLDG